MDVVSATPRPPAVPVRRDLRVLRGFPQVGDRRNLRDVGRRGGDVRDLRDLRRRGDVREGASAS